MSTLHVITGVAGFIGSHLAAALIARGDHVLGIDSFDAFYDPDRKRRHLDGLPAGGFRLLEMDIRDEALPRAIRGAGAGTVFHLAALAGVRPSLARPAEYVSVNVSGLRNVLDAVRAAGVPRLVLASSSSVYGDAAAVPFHEDDPAGEPISPYAATKRAGELLCCAECRAEGLIVAAARLFTVYGPRQRPDLAIARFMQGLRDGRPIEMFGDGTTSRDYTYVDDIVAGLLAAAGWCADQEAGAFRIFNLGGSRPVTLAVLIDTVARVTGRTPEIIRRPVPPGDVRRTWADLSRSRAELGFEPRTSLEEGLKRQWEWMVGESESLRDGETKRRRDALPSAGPTSGSPSLRL